MTLLQGNMGTESHREDGFPIEARRFKVAHKGLYVAYANSATSDFEKLMDKA